MENTPQNIQRDDVASVVGAAVRVVTDDPDAVAGSHPRFVNQFIARLECIAKVVPLPANPEEATRVLKLICGIQQIYNHGGISRSLLVPRLKALDLRLLEAFVGLGNYSRLVGTPPKQHTAA